MGHIGGLAREDELDRHLRPKVGALVDAAEVALGDLHTELDVRLRDLPIRIWYAPLSQHLSFHLYEEDEEVESILVFTNRRRRKQEQGWHLFFFFFLAVWLSRLRFVLL